MRDSFNHLFRIAEKGEYAIYRFLYEGESEKDYPHAVLAEEWNNSWVVKVRTMNTLARAEREVEIYRERLGKA